MFKKLLYISLALPLFFIGCDSIPSEVVESSNGSYIIMKVNAPVNYIFSAQDSAFVTSVEFDNSVDIKSVFLSFQTEDSDLTYYSTVPLFDNGDNSNSGDQTAGDNIFSAKIFMSLSFPSGRYLIEYFVEDDFGRTTKAAFKTINYDNGLANSAPVVSDVEAPDTVTVQDPRSVFLVSVAVSDSNGYDDIDDVWFVTTRPNGTSSGLRVFLYDDGTNGDQVPFDGRFSTLIEVTPANPKGRYKFDFQASDRGNKLSNVISHFIVIR